MLAFEAEQDGNWSARDLRNEGQAGCGCVVAGRQLTTPLSGVAELLHQQEHDRRARRLRNPPQHRHFPIERRGVFASHACQHDFNQASTAGLDCARERNQFIIRRIGARHRPTINRDMYFGARTRKAERAGAHRFKGQGRHFFDIGGCGVLVVRAAFVHHIGAQCAVAELGGDIKAARHRVERIEVFGKGFPRPWQAGAQRHARNVFDTFHELNQKVVAVSLGGRKADAAITHHEGRDAVAQGLRQHRIPGRLAIVMSVDVDPARRDQQAVRVDDFGGGAEVAANRRNHAILDGEVGDKWRRAAAVHYRAALDEGIEICHACYSPGGRADRPQPAIADHEPKVRIWPGPCAWCSVAAVGRPDCGPRSGLFQSRLKG